MSELDKLIEAMEAGGEVYVYADMRDALKFDWYTASQAYHGSLDAALAMHEALLPGWNWSRGAEGAISVWNVKVHSDNWGKGGAHLPTPARAWLLAILRAYRSTQ